MIENRVIVCIGSAWDYDPTSKHQIMKRLARCNKILWVNYHGSRKPKADRRDFSRAFQALRRVTRGLTPINESMYQLTPLVIPGASNRLTQRLHERGLVAQIRRAIRLVDPHGQSPVQVWSFAPDVPYLVQAFGEECFVYYCVDEYRLFDGYDASRIAQLEDSLLDRADLVIASADALLESRRRRRSDTVLVPHGVEFDHFASAWRSPPNPPSDVADLPQPIFGFFGLIHHWMDLELLADVARMRPNYSFVLIGEAKVDTSILDGLDNVLMLGRRPYSQLPAYCAAFDAGLMLFRDTLMTRHVNPIKMYEYLAAGLPVISTSLPEANRFPKAIQIAASSREFAQACDAVASQTQSHNREATSQFVAAEDWSVKVEYLSNLVMTAGCSRRKERAKVTADAQVERPDCSVESLAASCR